MNRYVECDFETASRADLLKIGAWKYAADDSTFVLSVQLKVVVDTKPQPTRVLTETQIHGRDPELMALCADPKTMFLAHNAGFEQAIWRFQMEPLGYPPMPVERWHDSMAVCGYKALPLGLDAAVTAMDLPIQKDMEGHRHMLKMCRPDLKGSWAHHTPENLQRLYQYGAVDVEAQLGLYDATGGLGRDERETWILDQYIQQRGILIDRKFVHACIDVLDQVRIPMTARFRELTGLNPTQREKVLNWINDQGVRMTDMRKETLNAILDPDDEFDVDILEEPLPPHVYEVIDLRRSLASSSVSKLIRMLECAGYDGRVRYTTQFHGARTGRDVGRLIQIQNYPRGEIGGRQGLTAEILADAIMTRDLDKIRELWGPDIFSAVISSLRSAIIAAPGKVLVTADYSTVEARNLLSFAGVHDRVEAIANGDDPYNTIGALIYKRPIDRKGADWKEGALAKNAFLGCFTSETKVLTHTGWKAIIDVLDTDLLWDGEWVTHSGLAYRGLRETLSLSGLRMTPEHLVYIGDRWLRADALTDGTFRQALDFAKARGQSQDMPMESAEDWQHSSVIVTAGLITASSTNTILSPVAQRGVINARRERLQRAKSHISAIRTLYPMRCIAQDCLIASPQSFNAVETQSISATATMAAGVLTLNSRIIETASNILSRFRGGITLFSTWIEKITIKDIGEGTSVSSHTRKIKETEEKDYPSQNTTRPWQRLTGSEPVYDLAHAGPRNRFTVMTSDGPIVVHNSGYGLGEVGFHARYCPKEPIALAALAVSTYRRDFTYGKVPKFWYGLFEASTNAVWCNDGKTYSYEGIDFRKERDFLTMRLPDGKKIWYHRPRRETTFFHEDERPAWSFMSYQGKRFRRIFAWHGMITADCIQGSARQLIMAAMKRAAKAGLNTIFKVHDELVFEETDRPDLHKIVHQIMEDIDPWAIERRLKVKAEVKTMLRYTK